MLSFGSKTVAAPEQKSVQSNENRCSYLATVGDVCVLTGKQDRSAIYVG